MAEASVLRSDKKLELYRRQLIASASEHVAAAAAGQNGAGGVTDEHGRYIPGADERVERAHELILRLSTSYFHLTLATYHLPLTTLRASQ